MINLDKQTIPEMLRNSFEKFSDNTSLVYVDGENLTYAELETKVKKLATILQDEGLKKGEKVAILSTNMPNWGVAFFAIIMAGGIAVPILPDFSPQELSNILIHSESTALLVSENLYSKVEKIEEKTVRKCYLLDTLAEIPEGTKREDLRKLPVNMPKSAANFKEISIEESDLASIIYTSGTTGKSKGVMLSNKNIVWNAIQCQTIQPINETDRFVSLLPLSHTYENTLGLLLPILTGAAVYYLQKPPTPRVLLPALKKVKPTIMLSVPLIIEKIYKKQIQPKFRSGLLIKFLYKIPFVRKKLNKLAGTKLLETFGGELKFFGIGGSKLDSVVEKFLSEGPFPIAIGYGLTETAPMLAGTGPALTRRQGIGPAMNGVTLKINNPDSKTGEGEIWAKGPNVMQGYFKEPNLTKEVLTEDGWFKTGDLGILDKDGYLFMKGRLKNMILGASGENIYPEEIESVINNFKLVVESLVVQRKGKLVALVHLNMEEMEEKYLHMREQAETYVNERVDEVLQELQEYVNSRVSKFAQVQMVYVQLTPFERTPTQKIKRFLYS